MVGEGPPPPPEGLSAGKPAAWVAGLPALRGILGDVAAYLSIEVDDLDSELEWLRAADVRIRGDVVSGPGGKEVCARGQRRQSGRAVPGRWLSGRAARCCF